MNRILKERQNQTEINIGHAKRKTSYKQGTTHLQLGVCNDEGKTIHTTSDLEKIQVLFNLLKSVSIVENTSNIPPMGMRCYTSIITLDITEKMDSRKLTNLNINKSPGHDSIHPHILKRCANSLTVPLSALFRRSFNEMHVPVDWKNANISAIFKKGDKTIVQNYLAVSSTSVIYKVIKSIINDHLLS